MRWLLVVIALVGCSIGPPAKLPERRPLVTDNLTYGVTREGVRAWMASNDWCMRRMWPATDEFVICNRHPYLNMNTPAMYSLVRYDAAQRSVAFAVFTPVPCRMYGRCDRIYGRTVYASEHDFVGLDVGLYDHLADRGRSVEPHVMPMPAMQQLMFDALSPELGKRFGAPTWLDPRHYGGTWQTPTSEIGLFVAGNGGWVVETHEMRGAPPGAL